MSLAVPHHLGLQRLFRFDIARSVFAKVAAS